MLAGAMSRKSVVAPLAGLVRPAMLAFVVMFAHQFVGGAGKSLTLRYYNIAYITNRGENMIDLTVNTSHVKEVRSVNFRCRLRLEFRLMTTFFLWIWPKMSNGLPSYVAGVDKDPRKNLYWPWAKAINMQVEGGIGYLDVKIVEPFYRQFGQYRCQANGITKANSYVKFVSAPFTVTEQWFASQFK